MRLGETTSFGEMKIFSDKLRSLNSDFNNHPFCSGEVGLTLEG